MQVLFVNPVQDQLGVQVVPACVVDVWPVVPGVTTTEQLAVAEAPDESLTVSVAGIVPGITKEADS